MITFDLKSGYHHVEVVQAHHKYMYLGFDGPSQRCVWCCWVGSPMLLLLLVLSLFGVMFRVLVCVLCTIPANCVLLRWRAQVRLHQLLCDKEL